MQSLGNLVSMASQDEDLSHTQSNGREGSNWNERNGVVSAQNENAQIDQPRTQVEPGMRCDLKILYERKLGFGVTEWVDKIPDNFAERSHEHG